MKNTINWDDLITSLQRESSIIAKVYFGDDKYFADVELGENSIEIKTEINGTMTLIGSFNKNENEQIEYTKLKTGTVRYTLIYHIESFIRNYESFKDSHYASEIYRKEQLEINVEFFGAITHQQE